MLDPSGRGSLKLPMVMVVLFLCVARDQQRFTSVRILDKDYVAYTGDVQAHRVDARVGEHGELVLQNLPFAPGQSVEVLVVPRPAPLDGVQSRTLRDSVVEYRDPFAPVADEY
jgi:hypothetical protein